MVILSLAPCKTNDDSNWLKPEVMSLPARQLAAEIDYRSAAHGEIFEWRQHVIDGVRSVAVHDLYVVENQIRDGCYGALGILNEAVQPFSGTGIAVFWPTQEDPRSRPPDAFPVCRRRSLMEPSRQKGISQHYVQPLAA